MSLKPHVHSTLTVCLTLDQPRCSCSLTTHANGYHIRTVQGETTVPGQISQALKLILLGLQDVLQRDRMRAHENCYMDQHLPLKCKERNERTGYCIVLVGWIVIFLSLDRRVMQ